MPLFAPNLDILSKQPASYRMPRANRHHIPGHIWHITHRCHKREFLLKFAKDRKRWLHWLFEAKKRYGLQILNYTVTSNHIHLMVIDGEKEVIPKSLQLVAGKTAQEYNCRKQRKGAFWEDRYHATAIESGEYLIRCLVYIDLNMVRNGVVAHPSAWPHSGYNEIQQPPDRYCLIDREKLIACCGLWSDEQLRRGHRQWVEESISKGLNVRDPQWSQRVAVGGEEFVQRVFRELKRQVVDPKGCRGEDPRQLREEAATYSTHFEPENDTLSVENSYYWKITSE
jgi:REP element-mobilizing transposase RayT